MPDTTTHILQLVAVALDEFETVPVSATVRRAWRIGRLRGDIEEGLRFALELGMYEDLGEVTPSPELELARQQAENAFLAGRSRNVESRNLGLDDIEIFLQQPLDSLRLTAPPHEQELSFRSRLQHENRRVVANDIVAGVRNDTFQYLMRCESTLRLSVTGERIFDRHRERVDRLLESVAPEVLDMLNAAIGRAAVDDDAEARVHALTSCRRVLTAVADVVFPARSEPYLDGRGIRREVGRGQYRNRILAALDTSSSTTHGRALAASLDDFAVRLERLDELTQKGVHEYPTVDDVDFGVIQTYLLAGEVLSRSMASGTPDATADDQLDAAE